MTTAPFAAHFRRWATTAALLPALACSGNDGGPGVEFPPRMRLSATAAGTTEGRTIDCHLDFVVELAPEGSGAWAVMGGEIFRRSLDDTEAGAAFWGDAYYEDLRISVTGDGALTLTAWQAGAPMPPVTDSRFWDGLRTFQGEMGPAPGLASGAWSCRPMDSHGDSVGTVVGEWSLVEE